MRTMWLSFVDKDRSVGDRSLGVAVVDVSPERIIEALDDFPAMHDPIKGPIIVAAAREAHRLRCNPGGEVLGVELTKPFPEELKGRLLSREDLQKAGLI